MPRNAAEWTISPLILSIIVCVFKKGEIASLKLNNNLAMNV